MKQIYNVAIYKPTNEKVLLKKSLQSYRIIGWSSYYGSKYFDKRYFVFIGETYHRNLKDALIYDYPEELV